MRRFTFFQQNNEEPDTKQIFVESELRVLAVQTFEVPMELNFDGMSKEEVYDLLINRYRGDNAIIYNYRAGPLEANLNIEFLNFEDFIESYYNHNDEEVMRNLYLD
jgi:hypothetical protein